MLQQAPGWNVPHAAPAAGGTSRLEQTNDCLARPTRSLRRRERHDRRNAERRAASHDWGRRRDRRGFVTACAAPGLSTQQASSLEDQTVGTWSQTAQCVTQDGKRVERFGADPKGLAIHDRNERFAWVLMRPDVPKLASNTALTATAEENRAIVQGGTAFFGRSSVEDASGILTTRIEGAAFPRWDGQDQRRAVAISGDEMRICVPGSQVGGGTACSVWRRAR